MQLDGYFKIINARMASQTLKPFFVQVSLQKIDNLASEEESMFLCEGWVHWNGNKFQIHEPSRDGKYAEIMIDLADSYKSDEASVAV